MRLTTLDLQSLGYNPDGTRIGSKTATLQRGDSKESDIHEKILAYCRSKGWPVVHSRMDVPQTAGIGTPDFVIALPEGRTAWVEAKTSKGKISQEQLAWMAALRCNGHLAAVVRSFDEFIILIAKERSENELINRVIDAACDVWMVTRQGIMSKNRTVSINKARFAVCRFLSTQLGMSSVQIGKVICRDHGAVCNALRQIDGWIQTEPSFRAQVEDFYIKASQ